MVYRSDLEALQARHDVLAGEVAAHTRELGDVAALLAEARARDEADRRMADLAAGGPARRRRKRIAIAAGVLAVVALVGGITYRMTHPVPSRIEQAIAQIEVFTDQACACKDKQCIDGVTQGMTKWATEMAKQDDMKRPELTDEQTKRITEITSRMGNCMTKAMQVTN